ncbi:fibrobacter succinogenes major paralogous domain [Candidatus Ornithobacterium hominis]|uniref:FISUMP domain-containing protein n=1 Tax=Candidatus Ornithobacterium hominis TaxID=2497989 RepID=UPI000E5ABC3A|nr:FISUMP domain-containing protein [Candidatus Ornithobacterium hominis]SZD72608.1 fibrobacter succinogenes major paralogous domain [Candidatus Ornithobacterium hominis]
MKKLLLSFVVLPGALATAQVGINTDTPQATLDISAKGNQEGDLRIEGVKEEISTQWLLVWNEKDQKVKRTSLSDLKWELANEDKIKHIRDNQPDRADDIIKKIKQCAPENILFDKHFGDGKHDFVYCATTVTETATNYNKTWLNLNLGAEYANIHSSHFDPTVNKVNKTDDEAANEDDKTYGSLYQWQRASDGHEFRGAETTTTQAQDWRNAGSSAFIKGNYNWVDGSENASGADLRLWQAGGYNNPCPSGYHVPTVQEWQQLLNAVGSQMYTQTKLPNLAAAGYHLYNNGSLSDSRSSGYYWSSSSEGSNSAHSMNFDRSYSGVNSYGRAYGASVRCIKDNN